MYADPAALLRLADELRARGDQARELAHGLPRHAATVDWHGSAADALHRVTRRGAQALLGLAAEHDRVAELLTEHAHHVADRLGIVVEGVHEIEHLLAVT